MVVRSDCCGCGEGGEVMWRGGSGGDDEVAVMVDRGDVVGRRWVAWRGGWWPDLVAGLRYPKGSGIETIVYADSDHAGDYVDRKSTSGVCTFIGCCLTSWFSKKQTALAISTTEAECVSSRKASQQALWMKQALVDYGVRLDDIPIMYDNKGAIDLSKNPVQQRTKHIEIRHHFLRDNVQKGNISIEKVSSEDNIANILTKPLKREPFNYLRLGLGMMKQID
ncbi:hypothetical protein Tco_0320095 [Tanacetum coccineum]